MRNVLKAAFRGMIWLGFGLCAAITWMSFDVVIHVKEMYPWLISEVESMGGAMNTLEEMQFKWALSGGIFAVLTLGLLATGIALAINIRRQTEEERFFCEYTSTDNK